MIRDMPRYDLNQIKQLPERVQDALFEADERFIFEVMPDLKEGEETDRVRELMLDVFFGALRPEKLMSSVAAVVPDESRRQEVTVKLLGLALLPLADYFGADVLKLIRQAGGDPVMFRRHAPARDVVTSVMDKAELVLSDDHLERRLVSVLESRIFEARNDDQVLALLTGPTKTSGVGLTAEQAATVLASLVEELTLLAERNVVIVKDDEYEKLAQAESEVRKGEGEPLIASVAPPPPNLPGMGQDESVAMEDEQPSTPATPPSPSRPTDEEEIAQTAKRMAETAHQTRSVRNDDLAERINQAVQSVEIKWADESLERRFRSLVDMYFRDLRDGLETKSKLTMPVTSGGLGLSDVEAGKVMSVLTPAVEAHRASLNKQVVATKAQFVAEQSERHLASEEPAQALETAELDRRFGVLTGQPPAPSSVVPPAPPRQIEVKPAAPVEVSAAPVKLAVPPPVNATATPAPLTDVRSSPKLFGPVDELRALKIVDFRRLSRDPHEATLKIRDKIDLLAEQSFENRVAGVKAWQESEPNRLYLELLRRSLDGQPVSEVIAAATAAGQPTLDKGEFDAIMEMNRQLRF